MQPRARRTIGIAVALFLLFGALSPVLADWKLEWEKLVSAAKKEGKVVVYMHSAFQPIGSAFVAEELPEDRRKMAAGILHTGYYFGFLLASIANYFIGATYGWRWMFIFGGIPALFILFIRWGVKESRLWHEQFGGEKKKAPTMKEAFGRLFTPKYRDRTTVMSLIYTVSIIGQWAGSIFVPTALTQIALREGVRRAGLPKRCSRQPRTSRSSP